MARRKRVACPGCQKLGRDASSNNLNLFPDDESRGYCHVCARAWSVDGTVQPVSQKPSLRYNERDTGLELLSVSSLPITALTHKPIDVEVCERYGVRTSVAEETCVLNKVYYPYHDQDGNVTGYKVRHLPKQFEVIGKIRGLFGQQQCKKNAKLLILTEGEDDALAAYQMLRSLGKDYNCVSIPNGANVEGTIDAAVRAELEFITSHQIVMIAFDNDKPGQATAKALAELICSQTRVKILKLPRKDAGQMLIDGMAAEFEKEMRFTSDFAPEAIENGEVEDVEELLTPIYPGVMLDFLPTTSRKLFGLRRGEVTVVIAPPGVGKTTMCGQITHELLKKQPDPVFGMFLEESMKKTRQRIVALHCGVPLNQLRRDRNIANKADVEWANKNLLSRLELLSNNKSLTTDDALLNTINYFVKAKGCKYGVVDHISYIIASRQSDNERKDIDTLLTRLTQLAEDQGIHLIVVSHIKNKNRSQDRQSKGKKYPYWEPLELDDARGSGAFGQLAHNVIAIERQVCDPALDDAVALSRSRILKNREEGVIGLGDHLSYNRSKGALEPLSVGY